MTVFYYPEGNQYPFDGICQEIITTLEKRDWKAPGIEVKFREVTKGKTTYKNVKQISGPDFSLLFLRRQGFVPPDAAANTAGISQISIPHKELHVYAEEECGPTLIIDSIKYSGSMGKPGEPLFGKRRKGQRAPYLACKEATNFYETKKVLEEFTSFLKRVLP